MDQDETWHAGKPRKSALATLCQMETSYPQKWAQPPIFGPCLLWPNGWMDEDATWYGGRSRPKPHCIRWEPSSPPKGAQQPPLYGLCLLWQTIAHLRCCWWLVQSAK